ncbi:uncharacterized protein LOC8270459 [Ricinus communis]|uniref:uncharacterized protein LOC8270459 n=1 Tax=Ricinus communis TaxID=3988 RepID=UPI000772AEA1|nr:uncharacterized protein LOC8270459 [Ricinus communis]|eukprot:XP_015579474.1 uncharacterized protein LOC8270459 [Ricinus communis]
MAPRRRSRKSLKGQMRMDAALDAMRSYGFHEQLVSASIKELLDVYGGDGWVFIEEACYKVLLENILEKVENEAKEKGGDSGGDNIKASASGPSSMSLALTSSNEEAKALELQSSVTLDGASQNMKALVNAEPTDGSENNAPAILPLPGGEESSWKDINLDQDSRKKEISNAEGKDGGDSHVVEKLKVSSPSLRPQEPVNALTVRRRKPCYGWISDSDNELDLVELTPAPLPYKLAKLLSVTTVPRRRKRRWDVRPEDM